MNEEKIKKRIIISVLLSTMILAMKACATESDGMISIQLYTNAGDHNSTAEWYIVDRTTAAGTDDMGNDINLS